MAGRVCRGDVALKPEVLSITAEGSGTECSIRHGDIKQPADMRQKVMDPVLAGGGRQSTLGGETEYVV